MNSETPLEERTTPTILQILLRLLWTIVYLFIFEVLKLVVQVTVLLDYIHLLIFRASNERLRTFGNRLSSYAYRLLRYATLNENEKPFPLNDYPTEIEPAAEKVEFDKS